MAITKGQLIVNCIKLLAENMGSSIDASIVSSLDEYKDRTTIIVQSINRAFHRLEALKKLPNLKKTIEYKQEALNYTIDFNDDEYNDILFIKSIVYVNKHSEYIDFTNYYLNEGLLVLPKIQSGEKYIITYQPKFIDIQETDNYKYFDTDIINYPERITSIIPYYVKAELTEEDNAQLAVLAMNRFETYANQLPSERFQNKKIIDVYGLF